jgi:hypothetical protein
MKTRALILAFALFVVGAAVCFAQNVQMGTWKLNEAKSKLSPGVPRNNTVVYEAVGQNVKVRIDGVGSDGKLIHTEWTGKFDSKDYPVIGDPNSNARSYTTIDERTLGFNVRKGGKTMLSGRIAVSADGKSRTVTTVGTDAIGKKVSSTTEYDKQ